MVQAKINVLLVDDDALLRDGLRSLLEKESFIKNVFEASDKETALSVLTNKSIDLVLLDIRLQYSSGLDILQVIKSKKNCPKVIVVTGLEGQELIVTLLKHGVDSILSKLDGYKQILSTIVLTLELGHHFTERILKTIKDFSSDWDKVPSVILNYHEKELLTAIRDGLTTKEIARLLKMRESTIETYRIRLLKKVGVVNTAALLAFAYRNGLL